MATVSRATATPTVICYNGINNSKDDAKRFARSVQRLVGAQAKCRLRYNSAASPTIMSALGKIGAISTVMCIAGATTAGIGAIATAVVTTAVGGLTLKPEIDEIQKVKAQLAIREAQVVLKVLNNNPNAHIVLVGHSQGADLVRKILDEIKEQKGKAFDDLVDRISAITIGGLDVVHCDQAERVFNLCNEDDNVARHAAPLYRRLFLASRPICHSSCCEITDDTGGHGTDAYLKNKTFVRILRQYTSTPSPRFQQAIVRRETEILQKKIQEGQFYVDTRQKKILGWLNSRYANDWIDRIALELQYMVEDQNRIQQDVLQLPVAKIDESFREIMNRKKEIANFQAHLDRTQDYIIKWFEQITRPQESVLEEPIAEELHIASRNHNPCTMFFRWLLGSS